MTAKHKDGLQNLLREAGAAVLDGWQGANRSDGGAIARICNAARRQNPQMPAAHEVLQTIHKPRDAAPGGQVTQEMIDSLATLDVDAPEVLRARTLKAQWLRQQAGQTPNFISRNLYRASADMLEQGTQGRFGIR